MAEILKIESRQQCYVSHKNLLAVNVPFDKAQACISAFNRGVADAAGLEAEYVFKFNENFTTEYDYKKRVMLFKQAPLLFVEKAPEMSRIIAWMDKNLKQRRYLPAKKAVKNQVWLIKGLTAVIIASILGILLLLLESAGLMQFTAQITLKPFNVLFNDGDNIMWTFLGLIVFIMLVTVALYQKSSTVKEFYAMPKN